MADADLQVKAIDALVHVHSAMKNVQLYPNVDPAITNSMEMLYLHLAEILRQDAPPVYAELEKKSLSGENILNQQEDGTIHISALLDILLGLGVKNISFDKDLENEELHIFINLLAKKPKPVPDEVELPKLIVENETAPIPSDNKVDEIVEEEPQIVSGPDIAANISEDIPPDNKVDEPVGKEQEIVPGPDMKDERISESVARMEVVFTRLNSLHGAIEAIPSEEQMDMVKTLSVRAAQWIEAETIFTPEYKEICHRLQTVLQDCFSNRFYAEAKPLINVFSRINNGTLKKDYKIREVSLEVIRNLASDSNINMLFKEINVGEKDKASDACQIFAGFGDVVMDKLLNGLKKASESKDRISIIHIIEEMGQAAIPAIKASINMNSPWYYLRNMAYILGRIGNENNIDILKPLLIYKDKRVRMEAFKSIGQAGGNKKGQLLLSVLPQVDQDLRVNIIEMLGKIRCTEAVSPLQDMLKSKSALAKDVQIPMQEKICKALGAIGSPEAIKMLSEIAESKSFLGIRSYPEEVKHAAKNALAYINRKQE